MRSAVHARANGTGRGAAPGRVLDLSRLLAEPPAPVPGVCDHFAGSGLLTTLVGPPGLGKSWLALLLAAGLNSGRAAGGIECAPGHAVYFDGENGQRIMVERVRAARVSGAGLTVVDADAFDLARAEHLAWAESIVEEHAGCLAVFDSLKRLTPNTSESENDGMAPVIANLARLARRTGAAVLLLHHRSVKAESADFRGASAIQDQSDLMFALSGRTGRMKLEARKFRVGAAPADRWLGLRFDDGGARLEATEGGTDREPSKRETLTRQALALANEVERDGGWHQERFARKLRVQPTERKTLQRALGDLVADHRWQRGPTGYRPPTP
jgi:hypothetical protein